MINDIVDLCSAMMQTFINVVSHIKQFLYQLRKGKRVLILRVKWNKAVHDNPVTPKWSLHPRFRFITSERNIGIFR